MWRTGSLPAERSRAARAALGVALAFVALAGVGDPGARAASAPRATAHADSATVVALLSGTLNAACPLPGVATAGQPDSARVGALARAGFRTLIDLRMREEWRGFEEASHAHAAGLAYHALPVSPATLADSTFDAFRALMQDSLAAPVLVHCASGNRVGALMLPWLVLDRGWSIEAAIASAEAGGLRTPLLKEKALDYVRRRARE